MTAAVLLRVSLTLIYAAYVVSPLALILIIISRVSPLDMPGEKYYPKVLMYAAIPLVIGVPSLLLRFPPGLFLVPAVFAAALLRDAARVRGRRAARAAQKSAGAWQCAQCKTWNDKVYLSCTRCGESKPASAGAHDDDAVK